MQKQLKSLTEIFDYCGGSMNLAKLLGLQQISVIAWTQRGIPHKHWRALTEKLPITLGILAQIDQKIRYSNNNNNK